MFPEIVFELTEREFCCGPSAIILGITSVYVLKDYISSEYNEYKKNL